MSERARDRAAAAFRARFGTEPEGLAFAPGRVNLIGDHVDYNDGLVLPMPLAMGTAIAWRRASGGEVLAQAVDCGGEETLFDPAMAPTGGHGWQAYVQGMANLVRQDGGRTSGLELTIAGDLPRGSGLSSSASLCIAVGRALGEAWEGGQIATVRLAQLAQLVEHRFAGVACGIMDQMACAAGEQGSAMLLDCRSLAWQNVRLPANWSVLLLQSGVTRELVDGAYNTRRRQCQEAAAALGVASLRDATQAMLEQCPLDPTIAMRARHVIGEIQRTQEAAQAITAGNLHRLGQLLRDSHTSLRDLFEVSHPTVDTLVSLVNEAIGPEGGARMTGGGFGGAIVAIYPARAAAAIDREIADQFKRQAGSCPVLHRVQD